MKKAGTPPKIPRDELRPPIWLALAQLLFAAVLLYVIRNPVSDDNSSIYASNEQQPPPAFVIQIPRSTIAVPAPSKPLFGKFPM